jgi:hypothetical protein
MCVFLFLALATNDGGIGWMLDRAVEWAMALWVMDNRVYYTPFIQYLFHAGDF